MAANSRDGREPGSPGQPSSRRGQRPPARPRTLADRVRGRVADELNAGKDRLTDGLEDVAETVRRMGEPLKEQPYGPVAGYVETAADRIERLAAELRQRGVDELAHEVGDLARTRPAVFVGATLAAGIVAARFLKSSSRGSQVTRTRD